MKGAQIILDHLQGREVAALMVDGQLEDLLVEPGENAPPAPGAIFKAVADRPLKGQGGMIMRLPDGDTALFRNAKGLSSGQTLLVQVIGYSEPGKAVPVTDRVIFKGHSIIVTPGARGLNISRQIRDEEQREALLEILHQSDAPQSEYGVIMRSAAAVTAPEQIIEEANTLIALADRVLADTSSKPELLVDAPTPHELAWRDWPNTPPDDGFEAHGVFDALERLEQARFDLGQGYAYIEPTHALTAVDVNTGGDFSPASGLKANLALARALPRQLRLRGLGGAVVLDLAPMAKKDRKSFEQALRSALKSDAIETALVGWTPLGHFELQRKRERLPTPKGLTS